MNIKFIFLVIVLFISANAIAQGWQRQYKLGDNVELKINEAMWQKCIVSENAPEGSLRVKCQEYVDPYSSYTRAGGTYIVHSKNDIRQLKQRSAFVATFNAGDKVEGFSNGKWYKAIILERKGEGYLVHWDGFSATYDEIVPAEKIRTTVPEQAINTSQLYIGEYACYGTGGRLMTGLGFVLLPNGRYHDLDKKRSGNYKYNPGAATIHFTGGFLSGQVGKNVKSSGFQLSKTVFAEPWR